MNLAFKQKIKALLTLFCRNELQKKRCLIFYNNFFYFMNRKKEAKIVEQDLFDYETILKHKYFHCDEYYKANILYGIAPSLKKYAGYHKPIKACIEHGVFFGKSQIAIESYDSGLPGIINFAEQRKEYLRPITRKPITSIGPYICYANDYCSESEIHNYKIKFGKTLLVFPTHSAEGVISHFDYDELIRCIEKIKVEHEFRTVLVCLYYKDIELGRNKLYEKQNYIVVCAGKREDPNFLSRQKSFINIADYTVSNAVGTHLGYCIALNKPHMLINQHTSYSTDSKMAGSQIAENEDEAIINKREVQREFLTYSEIITEQQKKVCDKYWGLTNIKLPDELYDIFDRYDQVYRKANHKEKLYVREAEVIFGLDSREMR
ncbi:MAG: hypothetical protein LUG99_10925 [Lachnospiraceae bacterium]|nr:hypothetical protein [Lachnospiraceae bacterium]